MGAVANKVVLAAAYCVGLAAAGFTAVSWGVLLFTAGERGMLSARGYLVHAAMILLALLVAWAVVRRKPLPVFLAFLGSLPMALYALTLPGFVRWTSVSVTLYLVAGALLVFSRVLMASQQGGRADV